MCFCSVPGTTNFCVQKVENLVLRCSRRELTPSIPPITLALALKNRPPPPAGRLFVGNNAPSRPRLPRARSALPTSHGDSDIDWNQHRFVRLVGRTNLLGRIQCPYNFTGPREGWVAHGPRVVGVAIREGIVSIDLQHCGICAGRNVSDCGESGLGRV